MKLKVTKLLFMLLTLGVIPALCSCGSDDKEEEREENSVTSSISHESPTNLSAMMSYVGHKIDDISKVLGDWGYDVMPFGYYEWKDRNGNALGTVEYYQVGKSSADYYCFLFINADLYYSNFSPNKKRNKTSFGFSL